MSKLLQIHKWHVFSIVYVQLLVSVVTFLKHLSTCARPVRPTCCYGPTTRTPWRTKVKHNKVVLYYIKYLTVEIACTNIISYIRWFFISRALTSRAVSANDGWIFHLRYYYLNKIYCNFRLGLLLSHITCDIVVSCKLISHVLSISYGWSEQWYVMMLRMIE